MSNNDLNQSFYEKSDDEEDNGTLYKELIVKNLSQLGKTADGTKVAYLTLKLSDHKLKNISSLSKFNEIQTLDLSNNYLRDLSVLSELPYLLYLDVSHNKVEKLFDFLPPYNLKEANFSYNKISEIGNLSNFHYLQSLELNNNRISKIEGLEYCQRLRNLNLSDNQIRKIEGLENLPLVNLDLKNNQIRKIEGLETLKFLCRLSLSNNSIKSLEGIPEKHEFLEYIDLENNKISNLKEIDYLVDLNLLRDLNLINNPIKDAENYRLSVIFKLPKLNILDRKKIDPTDKVNAKNLFHPSPEYIASRDHMTNFIFNIIQDHQVRESTLPSIDSPYPILILSGPEGSGAADIARKLADEYPSYFDYVATHSTRKPRPNEKDKVNYNFITMQEFEQDVTQGKFICCNEYFGNWYGIQLDSIESVARQGLACVTQMELESLLSFKQTYFEPRCVLVITLDKVSQIQRLISQGCSENECEIAINRSEWYAEYNRDHPGFFDAVIITDDISEGYENLRNLVLNYLGVADQQQQELVKEMQAKQNLQIQRELSNLKNRPKSNDRKKFEELYNKEIKEFELPRSDSFLPSNTLTGNRSQMSHLSIESLSQLYNTSLRMKFGSAPAQLLTQGEHAEKSLVKRASAIKKELELNNLITTQSQLTNQISKQAMLGTFSSNSWIKSERNTKSRDVTTTNLDTNRNSTNKPRKNTHYQSSISNKLKQSDKNKFNDLFDSSDEDDKLDDDYVNVVSKLKNNNKTNDRASSLSQDSGRLSNISTSNSIDE